MDFGNDAELACVLYDEEEEQRVVAHIDQYFGLSEGVFHEIASPGIHVDIHLIPPGPGRNYLTLVTTGMGAHRMNVPEDESPGESDRAELCIKLPPDWTFKEENDEEELAHWPIRWLKNIARLPLNYDTWVAEGHTVPTGSALPGTGFFGFLLLRAGSSEEAEKCAMPDGSVVNFYEIIPLHEEEMDFKLDNGLDALLERMGDNMPEYADPNRRNACEEEALLKQFTFTERIKHFADWFRENEPLLVKKAYGSEEDGSEAVAAFLSEGTRLLSPGITSIVGGDYELLFTVEGKEHLFFLHPRLVAGLRELLPEFRDKWLFLPWRPGVPSKKGSFNLQIYGTVLEPAQIRVRLVRGEEDSTATVYFYGEGFAGMEPEEAQFAFCILMTGYIGEAAAFRFISSVEYVPEPSKDMFPCTECAARLHELFADVYPAESEFNPTEHFFNYNREAGERIAPRDDLFVGTNRFMPLVSDFYQGYATAWRDFRNYGAKPISLYYFAEVSEENWTNIINERYDIQDALAQELLNESTPGTAIGTVLGGGVGEKCVYIDLLLYDEKTFRQKAPAFLRRFAHIFSLAEYRPGGEVSTLINPELPNLLVQLEEMYTAGGFAETVLAIQALPKEKCGYAVQRLLGKTLNSCMRFGEAYKVLAALETEGQDDPGRHFGMGFALYNLGDYTEAATHFQQALALGLDGDGLRALLDACLAALHKQELPEVMQ